MKKVVIMRGCPGSGKSTYVKKYFPDAAVCSADFYHMDCLGNYDWKPEKVRWAHQSCKNSFIWALKNNRELVIVDNTNTKIKEMKPYYDLALEYDYKVSVIRLEAPLKALYGKNIHEVPDEIVKAMFDRMEPWKGEEVIRQTWQIKE
jgi:predicted kinase